MTMTRSGAGMSSSLLADEYAPMRETDGACGHLVLVVEGYAGWSIVRQCVEWRAFCPTCGDWRWEPAEPPKEPAE